MKKLILMLIRFIDTIIIPVEVEHDTKRIQEAVTHAWQIAIKSRPVESVDSGEPHASR